MSDVPSAGWREVYAVLDECADGRAVCDGGTEPLERNCPWCGHDTLVRDGRDERCTHGACEYHVQGKYRDDV